MPGRTLAIGDIHGCDVALDVLLSMLEPAVEDTVVVLGDVVDRGPGTRQVILRLLELGATCELILLLGNHEEMMLASLTGTEMEQGWLRFGGQEALDSYGGDYSSIPQEHIEFLSSGRDFWETATDIFIHANLDPGLPLQEQSAEWLRWTRLTGFEQPHPSGKRVICGHTSQKSGLPAVLDGWLCIDTYVYGGGFLTGLDVETDEVCQAAQSGAFREFALSELE